MSLRTSLRIVLPQASTSCRIVARPRVTRPIPSTSTPFPGFAFATSRRNNSTFSSSEKHTEEEAAAKKAKDAGSEAAKDGKPSGGVAQAEDGLSKKVKELEEQVKDLKSQLTYGKADYINLTRRTEVEKTSAREFAIQSFASDLLSTIDILTIALSHVPKPLPPSSEKSPLTTLHDGVQMTKGELLKTLEKHGVKQFDPTGEKFDPNLHEALYQAPVPGKTPGTVLECSKLGYMLKGRTLRPAQVGVVQDLS